MKIVVFEMEQWERRAFEQLQQGNEVIFTADTLDLDNADIFADADIISVFIYSDLSQQVLERFKNLKMIATRSTGFEHIDIDYCRQHTICVSNVPSYGESTVAEHTFGLLLALSHHLDEAIDRTRKGDFSQAGLQGFDLKGKTIGVIGTGAIGRNVVHIAKGFGMHVLAFDIKPDLAFSKMVGFDYASMDDVMAQSDIVTIHIPSNPKTQNLISFDAFNKMKKGVVFINTSRGGIVDVNALLHALAEGKVNAAGLDVLPEEPTIREEAELLHAVFGKEHNLKTLLVNHILLRLRNVVITPHSAFNTREAVERILEVTVENIKDYIQRQMQNVVAGCK